MTKKKMNFLISALVSTYNSEKFLRGRLADLENQTIADKLEIIVIDSGSQQSEAEVVREFQKNYNNIVYQRTERESMYASWNRGIDLAKGKYLVVANTDDRFRKDAHEIMSNYLESHLDIDLVYGDCYLSTVLNETFEDNPKTRFYRYPDYFAPASLIYYQLGPQFMWRKDIHEKMGYFDSSYRAAGDYDFNIRFSKKFRAAHLNEFLGSYLAHDNAISFKDDTGAKELGRIINEYKNSENIEEIYKFAGYPASSPIERAQVHVDMGLRAIEYQTPWGEGRSEQNPEFALFCFEKAIELEPRWYISHLNYAATFSYFGNRSAALNILERVQEYAIRNNDRDALPNIEQQLNILKVNGQMNFFMSGLNSPSQKELCSFV